MDSGHTEHSCGSELAREGAAKDNEDLINTLHEPAHHALPLAANTGRFQDASNQT
jgi:hypothetical protein